MCKFGISSGVAQRSMFAYYRGSPELICRYIMQTAITLDIFCQCVAVKVYVRPEVGIRVSLSESII